jgi:hypothetical protein
MVAAHGDTVWIEQGRLRARKRPLTIIAVDPGHTKLGLLGLLDWQVVCGRRATKHRMQHLMSKMGLQPAIDVLSQHSSRVSTSVAYMDHLRAPDVLHWTL